MILILLMILCAATMNGKIRNKIMSMSKSFSHGR